MPQLRSQFRNAILDRLEDETLARLAPHLRRVDLAQGDILFNPGDPVREIVFPAFGTMISLILINDEGATVEVGVVGAEGAVGLSSALARAESPHQAITQIAGEGHRLRTEVLAAEFDINAALRLEVLRFLNDLIAQSSQTALCNRLHQVEERLARWLLMCQDRAGDNVLLLTHETLSQMLGTRRSSVSLSAAVLQNAGLIRYLHGKLTILDRNGLEKAACDCYASLARRTSHP